MLVSKMHFKVLILAEQGSCKVDWMEQLFWEEFERTQYEYPFGHQLILNLL